MSTSMAEHARDARLRAKLLQQMADKFPGATMDVLWDNGPRVVVASGNAEADARADRLRCASIGGEAHLIPYFVLRHEEQQLPVFVRARDWLSGAPVSAVLGQLEKDPAVHAAIMKAVRDYP